MRAGSHGEFWEHGPRAGAWLLGKWRLDRLLGRGGMSSVYSATHRNGNQVAIKILHPELASRARLRQRFLREGYIANRVNHPGAVRVLDDGVDGSCAFLVMELLQGQDLESLRSRRGGTLPAGEVMWLADRILEVLGAAHAAGIIHRDLKPQNLFVTVDGCAKLLDFGVASLRGVPGFTTLTDAAVLPGTPGYMAPEQVRGRKNALGAHTDIWGLGATLFRLLTGEAVYVAQTPGEMMVATATQPARAVRRVRSDIPLKLAQIGDQALASDPSARWPSAEAMRSALASLRPVTASLRTGTASLRTGTAPLVTPVVAQSTSEATWDASQAEQSHQRDRTLFDEAPNSQHAPGTAPLVTEVPVRRNRWRRVFLFAAPLAVSGLWVRLNPDVSRTLPVWRAVQPPTATAQQLQAASTQRPGASMAAAVPEPGATFVHSAPSMPSQTAPPRLQSAMAKSKPAEFSSSASVASGSASSPPVHPPRQVPRAPAAESATSKLPASVSGRDLLRRRH